MPGAAGELGIFANHAPLISLLEPGETRLTDAEGTVRRYATDDGYVQVRKNHAIVLVGEAVAGRVDRCRRGRPPARPGECRSGTRRGGDGDVHAARREVGFAEALVKTAEG